MEFTMRKSLFGSLIVACSLLIRVVNPLEPLTTGFAVGTALGVSALFAGYDFLACQQWECCNDIWIKPNISGLRGALTQKLHGQHLVIDSVVRAVRGHMLNKSPPKALVLSFHGWTGGGKNFVTRFTAEHLYLKGLNSGYVHLYVSTLHFPHVQHMETYKDQLRQWIRGNVTACARSMFVFDEMDKMPEGLIDTLKPFMDHHQEINGVDYRKAIFIFLSNTGGNDITKKTLEHWRAGKRREDITLKEMEEILTIGSFNEQGGLWHSDLIEKHLISAFIPFLPMEHSHVKLCIRDDLQAKGLEVSEEIISKVANELPYFPGDSKLYSRSGCKRVSQKVDLVMEEYSDDGL